LDVTNALTIIRRISNAFDGSEDDILWEDDGEDKDDSGFQELIPTYHLSLYSHMQGLNYID